MSDAVAAVRLGRPSARRVRVAGRWCVRFARYDGAGFHVVREGRAWLLPDAGAPVALRAGDAVLLPHGTGHVLADSPADAAAVARAVPFERWDPASVTGAGGGEVEMVCGKYRLDRRRVHPLLAGLPAVIHLPGRAGDHAELRGALDLLTGELDARRPGSGTVLPSLLDLLLVHMIRVWLDRETGGARPGAPEDPVTAAALRALHEDPAAPWTTERLAAAAGVSRATLARRFTDRVGRPPMAYLTWWRLTLAATWLRDTTDPLAAIARRVGYGSPYALSHAFSREFGITPGRYRARATAAAA